MRLAWALLVTAVFGCTTTKVEYVVTPVDSSADMVASPDLSTAPLDLSKPAADMTSTIAGDMAQLSGADMTTVCGSEAGIACCPSSTGPAYCADRGTVSGQRLVCHIGTCAECGGLNQLCCDGNQCGGGAVCAGPTSAYNGYCE